MGAHVVGQQEVLGQGPDKPQQTLCNTLHLSPLQVTNLSRHQAKTADGCLHPPQEGAFSHHHPRVPPTVNNCSGSSVSNTSPDRACSSSSVTMALYLSYKCTSAGREGAAFCGQHSQASIPPHLRSLYPPLIQMQLPAIPPSLQGALLVSVETLSISCFYSLWLCSLIISCCCFTWQLSILRTQQMKPPSCAAPGSGESTSHSLKPNICHLIPLELCLGSCPMCQAQLLQPGWESMLSGASLHPLLLSECWVPSASPCMLTAAFTAKSLSVTPHHNTLAMFCNTMASNGDARE